jgi:hypothetical protein
VTLCPATCSFTEMVTVHLRSSGDCRTYPHAEPVTKFPLRSWHARGRGRLGQAKAGAKADCSARWCALGLQ